MHVPKFASREEIVIPDGWERAPMMEASHTINCEGEIRPYKVPIGGPHSLTEIANAIIQLGEVQIRPVGYVRFPPSTQPNNTEEADE